MNNLSELCEVTDQFFNEEYRLLLAISKPNFIVSCGDRVRLTVSMAFQATRNISSFGWPEGSGASTSGKPTGLPELFRLNDKVRC